MARHLIAYVNCSKGGVTSVIRGRAVENPFDTFDAVFTLDRGGASAFDDLANVSSRIVARNVLANYLNYALQQGAYDELSIISMPDIADEVSVPNHTALVYEVHTSAFSIAAGEFAKLDLSKVDAVRVPSEYSAFNVKSLLGNRYGRRVEVVPNVIDRRYFNGREPRIRTNFGADVKPVLWVGRFDKGKGFTYPARLLAQLPESYRGYVIVSLEDAPERMGEFLSEASALGVSQRIDFRLNLPQSELADLMRSARDQGGILVSTSLLESFGYALAEAAACGLPVHAFDLPVITENRELTPLVHVVEPGDVLGMADEILHSELTRTGLRHSSVTAQRSG